MTETVEALAAEQPAAVTADQPATDPPADVAPTAADLDQEIADILSAPDVYPWQTFDETITKTKAAIEITENALHQAQAAAHDPAIIDPTALGKAHDAEHRLVRLRNAVEALSTHGHKALRKSRLLDWEEKICNLENRVVEVAGEVVKYAELTAKLADIMYRVDTINKEVWKTNAEIGYDPDMRHAKTVQRMLNLSEKVFEGLKLPSLYSTTDLWPPKPRNYALEYAQMTATAFGAQAWDPNDYESYFDEERGCYSARRKADAPPLPPLPVVPTAEEQEQQRVNETEKMMEYYREREAGRERLNAGAAARADAAAAERRRLEMGER